MLDEALWRKAVEVAAAVNPGASLALKGHLKSSQWVADGAPPEVLVIDSDWDGMSDHGAPFLDVNMDLRKGPLTQVILLKGAKPKVLFRTHHAVMDGVGTHHFIDDVFQALRGESPQGAYSTVTEFEMFKRFTTPRPDNMKALPNILTPTGNPDPSVLGVTWQRVSLDKRVRGSLAKVLLILAQASHSHGEGNVRFRVAVDMRRHDESFRSTANVTSQLFVDIEKNATERDVIGMMRAQLKEQHETWCPPSAANSLKVPLVVLNLFFRNFARSSHRTGRYVNSGTVSSLGEFERGRYEGGGFIGQRAYAVPIRSYRSPIFVTIWGNPNGMDLCLGMPTGLATNGRLQAICKDIRDRLLGAPK